MGSADPFPAPAFNGSRNEGLRQTLYA
jgi:hypothetical protein